jgi:mono/diheme cytochrome c family protein
MYDMRINAAILVIGGLSVAAATVTAGQDAAGKTVWSAVYSDAQAKRGEEKYGQYCAKCHGPDLGRRRRAAAGRRRVHRMERSIGGDLSSGCA